jgi:hypothetical protein
MRSNVTPHQRALNLAAEKAEVRAARAAKITTTLTAPGERVVKADGEYIGMVVREKDGWHRLGKGSRIAYRTFTLAAQALARRVEREANRLPVKRDQIVTLRDKTDGIETRHRVQIVSSFPDGEWVLFCGTLGVPYHSSAYEFVSVSDTW